jgi:4-alpha-glucanotransferase
VLLELEDGQTRDFEFQICGMEQKEEQTLRGKRYERRALQLPPDLPCGYHRICIEVGTLHGEGLLVMAPVESFIRNDRGASWGAFLPLYALHTERSWGAGDFSDFAGFIEWIASLGGNLVGTLPLFPAFLDHPLDPSPYAPVSRLFWNEFFVDPFRVPEWNACERARQIFQSQDFQKELSRQRALPLVDYPGQMRLKRRILQELATDFYNCGADRALAFTQFFSRNSEVEDYAAFRAVNEKRRTEWRLWPERMRKGSFQEDDFDLAIRDYHVYVQWLADQQFRDVKKTAENNGIELYLDLPLGVHPDGFDVWRNPSVFASQVAGGAPPDAFFTAGQNWGFLPLHPEQSRSQQHRYFRETLRHLLRHSDLIRIDHVMSLNRLYWVPNGFEAKDGVYVRYPEEELYAILTLESHRQRCAVIGEDLGTVPDVVRESMARHEIGRMYVGIFEVFADVNPPLAAVPEGALASLNTHDTATFASFWRGLDIEERKGMGLMDQTSYAEEQRTRTALREALCRYFGVSGEWNNPELERTILRQWLVYLSRSKAKYLLLNVEDLWLETVPQNVPGTGPEEQNWCKKTPFKLENFSAMPELLKLLEEINRQRSARDLEWEEHHSLEEGKERLDPNE